MIIRAVKDNPELINVAKFDWFNDYADTQGYIKHNCPELLERFEEAFSQWHTMFCNNTVSPFNHTAHAFTEILIKPALEILSSDAKKQLEALEL
jgi:hypothetical protein